MEGDFFEQFRHLVRGVFLLNPRVFEDLFDASYGGLIVLLVMVLARFSEAVGQSVVLFANRIRPWRFWLSLIANTVGFIAIYIAWIASIWIVLRLPFGLPVRFSSLALALALAYAPMMWSFLGALPYFGPPLSLLLSVWTLANIILGLDTLLPLDRWQAIAAAGGGWVVFQLGQRTIGRPLGAVGQWMRNLFAGRRLVTDWDELRAQLEAEEFTTAAPLSSGPTTQTWTEGADTLPDGRTNQRLWRFWLLGLGAMALAAIFATAREGKSGWFPTLVETALVFGDVLRVVLLVLVLIILLAPLESMFWWAGWRQEQALNPGVPVVQPRPNVAISRYILYLDGINQGSYSYLPEVEAFLNHLGKTLPPDMMVIKGIIPYSATNRSLTATNNPLAWVWRFVNRVKPLIPRLPIGFVVNLRNIFAVMASADRRYGLIQNRGLAQVLYRSLLHYGYQPGSGTPITLIGFSGGGQMSMGSVGYLQRATQAPIEVISIAGVISGNTDAMKTERVYHLTGTKDFVARLGNILFPTRWPVVPVSNWNRAKRRGRVIPISFGPVGHSGAKGPMSSQAVLPDGRTYVQQTLDMVIGILREDWLSIVRDRTEFVRPSNYDLFQAEATSFNPIQDCPVHQSLNPALYQPMGNWLGRLILPSTEARQIPRFIEMELYHAPPGYGHWLGRRVKLRWQDTPAVRDYVELVTMDVNFTERVEVSKRLGFVHPDRLNHWRQVDPLESIAGSHPIDDVTVRLPEPVEVITDSGSEPTLLLPSDPVHISGRYYGLVQILAAVGNDRFRVRHYNRDSGHFDGPGSVVYFPAVLPNRDDRYPSTTRDIEQSPLNRDGWYIYGAQNQAGEFVVQAIAPFHLFDLQADQVITGTRDTVKFINFDYWKNPGDQKGQVINTLLLPEQSDPVPNPEAVWQEGDTALLMEVYGGIGGNKKEETPGGIYFGHFSFGMARVVREPLTDQLRFALEYRQIFTHSPEAVISGSVDWTRFMGDRQYGRIGYRPVADVLIKFPPFTEDYDFGGINVSPMAWLMRELDVMAARYRIGDGTGTTAVTPVNSCVQDSNQALVNALNRLINSTDLQQRPQVAQWLQAHPDHEQTQRFWQLLDLLASLEANLLPLGFVRADWRSQELTLGQFAEETPKQTLMNTLASWRSLLPRLSSDVITMIFLQLGATVWVTRANQVGGDDPDMEPLAPTDFSIEVPKIKRAKRVWQ